jgi:hypothetical protein
MNTYVIYDPSTTLVIGITTLIEPPVNSLVVSDNDIKNIQSSGGIFGWTVQDNVLTWPTSTSILLSTQQQQINYLKQQCSLAIYNGFPQEVYGENHTITLREDALNHDQSNILGNVMSANFVMTAAKPWVANTNYGTNAYCSDGVGNYYVSFIGGLSGSAQPTWPTTFGVGVQDNTITWYKMGFRFHTTQGYIYIDPINTISVGSAFISFKNAMLGQYDTLKATIMSLTDPVAVKAVSWS